MAQHLAQRRVEFRDTDAAGIMHFTAFFTKMEEVEHDFLRSLGSSVVLYDERGKVSWPRVSAHCDYQRPVRFEDVLDVTLTIARLGQKSVTYAFDFRHGGQAVASGKLTAVCCRIIEGQPPEGIPIAPELAARLRDYVQPST